VRLSLRPDQIAIDLDLERPSTGRDERKRRDPVLLVFQQLRRQTDGFICVVSGDAVLDLDVHVIPQLNLSTR
jgi:hypothetical protein